MLINSRFVSKIWNNSNLFLLENLSWIMRGLQQRVPRMQCDRTVQMIQLIYFTGLRVQALRTYKYIERSEGDHSAYNTHRNKFCRWQCQYAVPHIIQQISGKCVLTSRGWYLDYFEWIMLYQCRSDFEPLRRYCWTNIKFPIPWNNVQVISRCGRDLLLHCPRKRATRPFCRPDKTRMCSISLRQTMEYLNRCY
jgi:hypothetical protein